MGKLQRNYDKCEHNCEIISIENSQIINCEDYSVSNFLQARLIELQLYLRSIFEVKDIENKEKFKEDIYIESDQIINVPKKVYKIYLLI